MDGDDPLARMRADADQTKEAGKEYAGTLWAFHAGLVKEGFTDGQAFILTRDFMTGQMRSLRSDDE